MEVLKLKPVIELSAAGQKDLLIIDIYCHGRVGMDPKAPDAGARTRG